MRGTEHPANGCAHHRHPGAGARGNELLVSEHRA